MCERQMSKEISIVHKRFKNRSKKLHQLDGYKSNQIFRFFSRFCALSSFWFSIYTFNSIYIESVQFNYLHLFESLDILICIYLDH